MSVHCILSMKKGKNFFPIMLLLSIISDLGIIDAAKVTRSALQNAASIAALFLTTEAVIADAPEENAAAAGMPDMDF